MTFKQICRCLKSVNPSKGIILFVGPDRSQHYWLGTAEEGVRVTKEDPTLGNFEVKQMNINDMSESAFNLVVEKDFICYEADLT